MLPGSRKPRHVSPRFQSTDWVWLRCWSGGAGGKHYDLVEDGFNMFQRTQQITATCQRESGFSTRKQSLLHWTIQSTTQTTCRKCQVAWVAPWKSCLVSCFIYIYYTLILNYSNTTSSPDPPESGKRTRPGDAVKRTCHGEFNMHAPMVCVWTFCLQSNLCARTWCKCCQSGSEGIFQEDSVNCVNSHGCAFNACARQCSFGVLVCFSSGLTQHLSESVVRKESRRKRLIFEFLVIKRQEEEKG